MALLEKALGAMKQGLSPEKAALGLAAGAALGLFPALGTTTLLCVAAGAALGLNHGILQTANYAVSLLYVPVFYGLMRLGEALVGAQPLPLSPASLAAQLASDPASLLTGLGAAGFHAFVGWLAAAPVLAATVYLVAVRGLGAWASRYAGARELGDDSRTTNAPSSWRPSTSRTGLVAAGGPGS